MTVQQREAWFHLVVCAAVLATQIVLALIPGFPGGEANRSVIAYQVGKTNVLIPGSPWAWGGLVVLCVLWLGGFVLRRQAGEALLDERDQLFGRRAQLIGLRIFWICFVSTTLLKWIVVRFTENQETVPVDYLLEMVFNAWILFLVSHAIAVLVQYGRSHADEH